LLNAYQCKAKKSYIRILTAKAYLRKRRTDHIRIRTVNAAYLSGFNTAWPPPRTWICRVI